jgi:hypothetical protein
MVGRPPPPPFSGDPFPPLPLPLSYRAALAAPLAGVSPPAGAPPGLAAPPASFSPAIGASPGPLPPPTTISSAAGAPLGTATSLADLPSAASEPPAVAAPPAAHFPAVSGHARPFAAGARLRAHRYAPPTVKPPPPAPTQSATLAATFGHDRSQSAPTLFLPDAALLRSQLLAPGFPHVPLDTTGGAPVRGCPLPTTVYSQPSAIISSLRTPSDDVAAILATTRAAVTVAHQRAQDATRALEQEQAVVDAIERQYAETYRRLAGKGVSDGSPTSARHSANTFQPAPAPASTLRASLHAQAPALTSIRATITDVLAPDSTQYPRWRDQVLQTLRRYALADHVLSAVPDPSEDWLLMDEVVLSWIHGTLTTEL